MFRSKRKSSGALEVTARNHKGITMGTKVKMIERLDQGRMMVPIAHSWCVCVYVCVFGIFMLYVVHSTYVKAV